MVLSFLSLPPSTMDWHVSVYTYLLTDTSAKIIVKIIFIIANDWIHSYPFPLEKDFPQENLQSSLHGFTMVKSRFANLISFYDEMSSLVDEGRAVDIFYLDFSKAFCTVSHDMLLGKLKKRGLDEWTLRWIEICLNSRHQRVVISDTV